VVSPHGHKPVDHWPGYHGLIPNGVAGQLIEHGRDFEVQMVGDQKVTDLTGSAEAGFEAVAHDVVTRADHRHRASAVIVAIGGGAFEPRRLKVPGEDGLGEDVLTYRMPDKSRVAGKRVVGVGGGD